MDYPTIIEGQTLLDLRALHQMHRNSPQTVVRYKDAFRDQPKGDQFEGFLKVRYMNIKKISPRSM